LLALYLHADADAREVEFRAATLAACLAHLAACFAAAAAQNDIENEKEETQKSKIFFR
tara:strand:+ start:390 stop:563 length:174 start_codon:yes stop_codon:yes gene_type:complete